MDDPSFEPRLAFVPDTARQVLIVSNPNAGQRQRHEAVHALHAALSARQLEPRIVTQLTELDDLVARAQSGGQLRAVVAAGGDGTLAEVVNRTAPDVPVTVFPLGTANLMAKYFGIEASPQGAAEMIAERATLELDAGRANGRIFLLMAGCGFDAEVVQCLHDSRAGSSVSYWSYRRPIWQAIRSYRYPALRVYCDRPSDESRTPIVPDMLSRWAFAVNLPAYAGGLQLVPEANGVDGQLNICTFAKGGLLRGLHYLAHVKLGMPTWLSDYQTRTAQRVRIEADEPVRYQLDGDPGGMLPLEIEVLPRRVKLLAPRASIEQRLGPTAHVTVTQAS